MSKPTTSLQRWFWSVFIPLTFIHLFVFVRIPMNIYLADAGSHTSPLTALVANLALFGLGSLLLLVLFIFLIFMRWRTAAGPMLIALALTYWLVDSFFARSYPALDGAVANLPLDGVHLMFELLLFGALFNGLALARRAIETSALLFLLALSVFNSFWVINTLASMAPSEVKPERVISAEQLFTLSDRKNLLIILMDTFQSDYLQELLDQSPALGTELEGFHNYSDTLSVAPSTFMSLPAIHSGRMYDPKMTMAEYFQDSIRTSSVLARLASQGYEVSLLNPIRHICPQGVACLGRDSLLRNESETSLRETLYLLDISLMRSAPEFLKNTVLNQGRFVVGPIFAPGRLGGDGRLAWDDSRILDMFIRQVEVRDIAPRAVFLHLMNTHPPYVLGGDCQVLLEQDSFGREGALQQASCAMLQFTQLMAALRSKGVYDRTLIILLGDHGSSSHLAEENLASTRLATSSAAPAGAARLVGSANPVLMVKPIDAHQNFHQDPKYADLADLPATICADLAACQWETGIDLLSSADTSQRTRRFMSYVWEDRFWNLGYIPSLDFYTVAGPLNDWASWTREDVTVSRILSGRLDFSNQDDFLAFGAGWGVVEQDPGRPSKRWAIDRQAELFLDLDPPAAANIVYQLNFEIYIPDFIVDQAVSLSVNGQNIGRREAEYGLHIMSFRVPSSAVKAGSDRVTLTFDTVIPAASSEQRSLAAVFLGLTIEQVNTGEGQTSN